MSVGDRHRHMSTYEVAKASYMVGFDERRRNAIAAIAAVEDDRTPSGLSLPAHSYGLLAEFLKALPIIADGEPLVTRLA